MVLVDDINVGFDDLIGQVIREVNGKRIKGLKEFITSITEFPNDDPERLVVIRTTINGYIALPSPHSTEAIAANKRILERYHVKT